MTHHVAVLQPPFEGLSRLVGFLASKPKHMTFLMFAALIGGVTVAGFGIGTGAAVASMVPGGLGVQEGTTTGVFALLGVDVDRAVAIAVMFRFLYFFVPFAMSLVFYKWLLSRRDRRDATCLN